MAQAIAISLSKFTAAVQAAVKAAVAKHPKFKIDPPQAISVSYLIRGIPIPDPILSQVTLAETQAFANEIAGQVASAFPDALVTEAARPAGGAALAVGGHYILGIPPAPQMVQVEK